MKLQKIILVSLNEAYIHNQGCKKDDTCVKIHGYNFLRILFFHVNLRCLKCIKIDFDVNWTKIAKTELHDYWHITYLNLKPEKVNIYIFLFLIYS